MPSDPKRTAIRQPEPERSGRTVRYVLLFGLGILTSCTTIEIRSGEEGVRLERRLGFASVEFHPHAEPVVARVRALGIRNTPFGFGIGYADETIAALPAECRLVLWVEREEQIELLGELLGDVKDVCAVRAW